MITICRTSLTYLFSLFPLISCGFVWYSEMWIRIAFYHHLKSWSGYFSATFLWRVGFISHKKIVFIRKLEGSGSFLTFNLYPVPWYHGRRNQLLLTVAAGSVVKSCFELDPDSCKIVPDLRHSYTLFAYTLLFIFADSVRLETYQYWVTQKQIYTANHATFPIQIRKITVQICSNFWVTEYVGFCGKQPLGTL